MQSILIHSHSIIRWLVLLSLVYAIIRNYGGWRAKRSYTPQDRKSALLAVAIIHLQLILGIILYILDWGTKVDFSQMKNSVLRFYTVEHSLMMLIAVVLVTWANAKAKRIKIDQKRFKMIWFYFLIALLLIIVAIPWPFRSSLGGGWF